MWAEDNVKNYPYLLINPLLDANGNVAAVGPQAYTKAPELPPVLANLYQVTEQDIQDVLGNQQAAEKMVPNISGKAIELVQNKLDMQTFIYVSNMAKAIRRSGEIWLGMARDTLVEDGRRMKGITEQGETTQIELRRPLVGQDGSPEFENDIGDADFDVAVDVGPSSASRRQATVRALTSIMGITQDPETLQVLSSMVMMNMEGDGVADARDFFRRKLIRMGVVKPTPEESQELAAEMQNQKPDPNSQFLLASAEQAQAEATKARADTVLTVARAEEAQAKTIATLAGVGVDQQDQAIRTMQALGAQAMSP